MQHWVGGNKAFHIGHVNISEQSLATRTVAMDSSLLTDAESRMHKAGEVLKREMNTIRAGRASPALVESVIVDYNGVPTPLNQLATISAPEARLLVIQPWDRQSVTEIERGILKSSLGLNPASDGAVIRVQIPMPTEERRRDLVKVVRQHAEEARVAVRNVRRDVQDKLRAMERSKEISQDENRRLQDRLQKLTDGAIVQIDVSAKEKEVEIMEV